MQWNAIKNPTGGRGRVYRSDDLRWRIEPHGSRGRFDLFCEDVEVLAGTSLAACKEHAEQQDHDECPHCGEQPEGRYAGACPAHQLMPAAEQRTKDPVKAKVTGRKAAKKSHAERLASSSRADVKRFLESHGPQYFDELRNDPVRLRSTGLTAEDISPEVIASLSSELRRERSEMHGRWAKDNGDPHRVLTTAVEGHPDMDPEQLARKSPAPDYNDPTPETIPSSEESVMSTATKIAKPVKISEEAARNLLASIGIDSGDAPLKKVQARIEALADTAKEPDFKEPEDAAAKKTLKAVLGALEAGKPVEVGAAEPPKAASNGHAKNGKSHAPKEKSKTKVESKEPREGSITSVILGMLRSGPVDNDAMHKKLVKKFPDRNPDTLRHTLAWNLSTGLPRKGIEINKTENGYVAK